MTNSENDHPENGHAENSHSAKGQGQSPSTAETLFKFPCEFTIKVFGKASADFETAIFNIIRPHVPSLSIDSLHARISANGKYAALSVVLWATSKAQLDAIYQDLSSSPIVLMTL